MTLRVLSLLTVMALALGATALLDGCSALYHTTYGYQVDPVTGKTNSVAVTVTPNATVTDVLSDAANSAALFGPYAPLVTGIGGLLAALLGVGAGFYQRIKQQSATQLLDTVIDGVERSVNSALPVKDCIQAVSVANGVADKLDVAVQART